jgi:Ca-activated chloride channel family protein
MDADLGGTEVIAPLKEIFGEKLSECKHRCIVLITDGEVGNEAEVMQLCSGNSATTTVFTVGIGYAPNEHLMRGVARATGGTSESIAPGEKIEPKILRLFRKVTAGRAKQLKIDWGTVADQSPFNPVAFGGETVSVFARVDELTPPDSVNVSCLVNGTPFKWTAEVERIKEPTARLPLAWARERIRDLEEGRTGGSKQLERTGKANRSSVIEVSKKYDIISSETSFVAIEERLADGRTLGEAVLRKVPVMLAKGWHGIDRMMLRSTIALTSSDMVCCNMLQSDAGEHASYFQAFSTPVPACQQTDTADDLVLHILSLQRLEGGFSTSDRLLTALGLTKQQLSEMAAKLNVKSASDREVILITALVIAVLNLRFSGLSNLWKGVTVKSEKWLQSQVKKTQPVLSGKKLRDWANEYAARLTLIDIP